MTFAQYYSEVLSCRLPTSGVHQSGYTSSSPVLLNFSLDGASDFKLLLFKYKNK